MPVEADAVRVADVLAVPCSQHRHCDRVPAHRPRQEVDDLAVDDAVKQVAPGPRREGEAGVVDEGAHVGGDHLAGSVVRGLLENLLDVRVRPVVPPQGGTHASPIAGAVGA